MNADAARPAENPYDAVPYRDHAYPFTHPRFLETMGVLFGMTPPDIGRCRTLELGCAGGGNIIPQAFSLPEATFLGVDLAERQIAEGNGLIAAMGLRNIELRQADIMDIDASWGEFDYIISHGVFSWLPPAVQEKLLDVSAKNLAPNGIAFVSYNTYPGWHLANVVRDLMRYHAGQFDDPRKKIEQGKAILNFLVGLDGHDRASGMLLKEELEILHKVNDDAYIFHEHLEADNNPIYFYQFVARAEAHGLQYLADADFSTMLVRNLPAKAREPFARLPLLQQEQYMDFIRGRRFRKSLLCRQGVPLDRGIKSEAMQKFHFALSGPVSFQNVDVRNDKPVEFAAGGAKLTTVSRVMKAAMLILNEAFPGYVPFSQLYAAALARAQQTRPLPPDDPHAGPDALAGSLLTAFSTGMVDICLHPPRWTAQAGDRPLASPLARAQLARGRQLASLRHAPVELDPLSARVMMRLDGRHDRRALLSCVREAVAAGDVRVERRGWPDADPDPAILTGLLDNALTSIARSALLVE